MSQESDSEPARRTRSPSPETGEDSEPEPGRIARPQRGRVPPQHFTYDQMGTPTYQPRVTVMSQETPQEQWPQVTNVTLPVGGSLGGAVQADWSWVQATSQPQWMHSYVPHSEASQIQFVPQWLPYPNQSYVPLMTYTNSMG